MARLLAISSQVARGHVGLSAIVPALQALGHEVIALPTILLSNHPGHAHIAGERIDPALLHHILDALAANGWLVGVDAVLAGYLPSAGHVAFVAAALDRLRAANARLVYLCDPVIGDEPKGLYIAPDAAEAIRDRLVPQADILKLNRFELAWLAGESIADASKAAMIAKAHAWPQLVVTSLPADDGHNIENALVMGGDLAATVRVARHPKVPNGTGDLISALLLGHQLASPQTVADAFRRAVEGVRLVVERSLGADELRLVASLGEIATCRPAD